MSASAPYEKWVILRHEAYQRLCSSQQPTVAANVDKPAAELQGLEALRSMLSSDEHISWDDNDRLWLWGADSGQTAGSVLSRLMDKNGKISVWQKLVLQILAGKSISRQHFITASLPTVWQKLQKFKRQNKPATRKKWHKIITSGHARNTAL